MINFIFRIFEKIFQKYIYIFWQNTERGTLKVDDCLMKLSNFVF